MQPSLPRQVATSLVFLALNPFVGTAGFVVVVTGTSMAAGLAVTVIGGLVCLWLTMLLAVALGRVQRAHLRFATGAELPGPPPVQPRSGTFGRLAAPVLDPYRWKAVAFWFVEFVLGWVTTGVVYGLLAIGAVGVTLPLYARWLSGVGGDLPGIGLLFAMVAGAAALVSGLAGSLLAVRLHELLARALLGTSRTIELESRVSGLEGRVSGLDAARTAAIDTAEAERRRIERDLHDGTQQRLVGLAMGLGMAREKFDTDPDAARSLVDEAHRELKVTMAELRSITRGLRPSVLEDRGLDAALSALVARSPIPVDIEVVLPHRPPPPVESAAYFAVAEALTNIARHAEAQRAAVHIRYEGDTLVVDVGDDGRGNARRVPGGGLDGLADRLAALHGRLHVVSPEGGPTLLRVEVPCGS
ncbi:MAG: sensor histidine kinase [Acidimicrobiia bacterium]